MNIKKMSYLLLAGFIMLGSCKKKDNDTEPTNNAGSYVLLTAQSTTPFTGYITSFGSTFPSSLVSNITSASKQCLQVSGFRSYGKYIYKMGNAAGEAGVQKFSVDANNAIKDEGFIPCGESIFGSGQHLIVTPTEGYYFDGDLGTMKIQKFNPTTMQRTGQLDLTTQLANAKIEYISVGQNILMNKEGKLYANIHYGKNTTKGYLDAVDDTIRFAVINMATGTLDKITKYKAGNPQQIGWLGNNAMWDMDDDGSLYFCAMGKVAGGDSQILRFKHGENDIDATWVIKMDDFTKDGCFHNVFVKNGKLYTRIPTEGIASDFSNMNKEIWEYYIIDVATKTGQKIAGVPSVFFNGNANAIVEIDNEIYLMVTKDSQGINGFYKVTGTSASQAFNVNEGGKVCGFVKLQ